MDDVDEKTELPIHLILETSDYAKLKTATKPRVNRPGEPVVELAKFGWTQLSPGTEDDLTKMLFAKPSAEDCQRLWWVRREDQTVYQDFKDQRTRSHAECWYERLDSKCLPSNKTGSLARLDKLARWLEKIPELFKRSSRRKKSKKIMDKRRKFKASGVLKVHSIAVWFESITLSVRRGIGTTP